MRSVLLIIVLLGIVSCASVMHIPMARTVAGKSFSKRNAPFKEFATTMDNVELSNVDQMMYTGQIQIGLKNQKFTVVFDTGSSVLWLAGSSCTPQTCSSNFKNLFQCTENNMCTNSANRADVYFGFGEVVGTIAQVSVSFPGLSTETENILLVDKTVDFEYLQADGIFGLGVYNDERFNTPSAYILNLYKAQQIPSAMFSMYMGFHSDSQLSLGGFDSSKMTNSSNIYYHQVIVNGQINHQQRWVVEGGDITFGDVTINLDSTSRFIIDSGTSMIALSELEFIDVALYLQKNFNAEVHSDELTIILACDAELPDLVISIPDLTGKHRQYTIPPSFYLYALNTGNCQVLIDVIEVPGISVILGDVFMRRYVSIFDYNSLTVGLTLSIANPISENSSGNGFPVWAIILIVVAAVGIAIGVVVYIRWRKAKQIDADLKTQLLVNHSYAQSQSQPSQIVGNKMLNNNHDESEVLPIRRKEEKVLKAEKVEIEEKEVQEEKQEQVDEEEQQQSLQDD